MISSYYALVVARALGLGDPVPSNQVAQALNKWHPELGCLSWKWPPWVAAPLHRVIKVPKGLRRRLRSA